MDMDPAQWIWCTRYLPNTYCCARGALHLRAQPVRGTLRIAADSRYQVWVNGQYVGQGPTPFKPPYVYVDSYDIVAHLRTGRNVIAVLGNYHGVKHCTYTPGTPGILALAETVDAAGYASELATGSVWKALALEAYTQAVPRRTWATPWCEYYDARHEPTGWKAPEFDDSSWPCAQVIDPGPLTLLPRIVPPLEEWAVGGQRLVGIWRTVPGAPLAREGNEAQPPGLTAWLDEERLKAIGRPCHSSPGTAADSCWPLALAADEGGTAFAVDLEKEMAGQIEIDVDCPAGITIDLCPAELLRGNRPWCFRKAGEYARRYVTRTGRQQWRCFGYDGIRYIHAVVRGPHPRVVVHGLGAWQRQSALPIRAEFECSDPVVNRIWSITCHSMRVGSQEIHVDCPTREQTSAWGDHIWSGLWAGYLTGDFAALRHLVLSMEHVQLHDGQLPCYPFASDHDMSPAHAQLPLYDYSLIAVWGLGIYYRATGERDAAARLAPVCDRVLDWYRGRRGPTGLIEMDGAALWKLKHGQLFIDHPGLGSHNAPYPPLDRRGINTALNCFFILALEAQAGVLDALERTTRAGALRAEAAAMRGAADRHFYVPAQTAYADGHFEGQPLAQISQQSNALAVLAGVCPRERAPAVLARVLDPDDPRLCRCGTYFWTYLAEALCRSEMHSAMWREVVRLWNAMAEQGATTWWETFLGDELDSLCHIWSCVPGYLILAEILGVQPAEPGFRRLRIRPRFDLLPDARGSVPVPGGAVRVAWKNLPPDRCELAVECGSPAPAVLELPSGWMVEGTRERVVPLPFSGIVRRL